MTKTYTYSEFKDFIKRLGIPWPFMMNRAYLNRYKTKHVSKKKDEIYTTEDIKNYLGWRELKKWEYDCPDGYLVDYCWFKTEDGQAGFLPINKNLIEINKIISNSKLDLDHIYRRLTYFAHLENILNYIREKYDWEILPISFEYYLNVFEFYIFQMVHLSMFFIQLYYEQSPSVEPSKKPLRFEDLIDAFKPVELKEMGFQSLYFSLYITAFNEIRNQMVHSSLLDIQRKGQDGYLSVELPHKKRKGLFNDYLKSLFDDYKGKLICDNYLSVEDDRFLEFNFQLRISKKAKLDIPNSIVTYSSTISETIKQSAGQLFLIAKWTTDQLLSDLS